ALPICVNRHGGAVLMDAFSASQGLRTISTGNAWNLQIPATFEFGATFSGNWGGASTGTAASGGNWHFVEFGIDFDNNVYLYAILDQNVMPISGQLLYSNSDSASKELHFSIELAKIHGNSSLGWMHVAQPSGGYF